MAQTFGILRWWPIGLIAVTMVLKAMAMIDEKVLLAQFSQKIQFYWGSALSLSIVIEPTRELQSLVSSSSDVLSRFYMSIRME